MLRIAPTTVESRDASGIEDYWQKSCILIYYMKKISKHFRSPENRGDIAVIATFSHNAGATLDWQKKAVT
jgi:hypothetical protein